MAIPFFVPVTAAQISHSTFNASFSAFLRSIHGFRFSVSVILSSKFVPEPHSRSNHARFVVLAASGLRGFRFHETVSFPRNRSVSSESVWFLLDTFGFQETARKRKVRDVLYGAMITFHGNVRSDLSHIAFLLPVAVDLFERSLRYGFVGFTSRISVGRSWLPLYAIPLFPSCDFDRYEEMLVVLWWIGGDTF
ncbi:hypothetical protein E2542_SST20799 [Spatholobus suberectus]|nr:hypothetical protein E2542_SST20799 [Spatholobus suberectus]